MDNNNYKETLYTFKFTESELIELSGALDRASIYFPDDTNTNKFKNLFNKKRESIIKKRLNLIKRNQKKIIINIFVYKQTHLKK